MIMIHWPDLVGPDRDRESVKDDYVATYYIHCLSVHLKFTYEDF